MIWRPAHHKRIAQAADALTVAASFIMAYYIWNWFRLTTNIGRPFPLTKEVIWGILAFSLIWVSIFNRLGAYSYIRFTCLEKELKIVFKTTVIGLFIFFALFFLFRPKYVPRAYIIIFAALNLVTLSLEKIVLFYVASILRKRGKNLRNIIVVGTGKRAKQFIETVEQNISWGLDIIGLVTGDKSKVGQKIFGYSVIGSCDQIEEILHKNIVDEVIICVSTQHFDQIQQILECCEREGVQVRLNFDFFGKIPKKVRVDYIYGLPIISFIMVPDDEFKLYIKRMMDILISAFLIALLSPLFIIIAILIKATSKGPVFYEWNVVGFNKKPFKSWKFRTMFPNADQMKDKLLDKNIMKGPVFKIAKDPRITKLGKILRKFSLDELPQLWSVLKGDMSLVGPRPAGPHELERYESWQRRKLSIKPGITCLWQVSGRNKINDFDEWVKLDLQYIDNWSLWLDLKILLKTIRAVLTGTGL